jgi:hypothetical protein
MGGQGIVGAPHAGASLGVPSFGIRHRNSFVYKIIAAAFRPSRFKLFSDLVRILVVNAATSKYDRRLVL